LKIKYKDSLFQYPSIKQDKMKKNNSLFSMNKKISDLDDLLNQGLVNDDEIKPNIN
jgi:hypothetical protein